MDGGAVGAVTDADAPLAGSLPVKPADADGFDFLMWAFCMWVLLWTALFYACSYWASGLLGPRLLPPSRKEHENDCYWVGRNLVGVLHAALIAVVALPALAVFAGAPDTARFACTGHLGWCSGGPRSSAQLASVAGGELAAEAVAAAGLAFTAFIAADLVLSVLHGYASLDHVVHHLAFVTAGLIIRWHCMLPFNAAALLSMEVSTPFLNFALLYRHRGQEFALPVRAAGVLFVALYVVFRLGVNSYAAIVLWLHRDVAIPPGVPEWQGGFLLAAVAAGVAVQLFWLPRIVQSFASGLGREREDADPDASADGCELGRAGKGVLLGDGL